MAKTIYDYWFTQFGFPDEHGKPYLSSSGQMVWNETAKQKLPVGWSCSKMETAIENIRTGLNPRDNFKLGGGSIKYITVKNLRSDGVLDFSGCDTIDEAARQIVHRRSDVAWETFYLQVLLPWVVAILYKKLHKIGTSMNLCFQSAITRTPLHRNTCICTCKAKPL